MNVWMSALLVFKRWIPPLMSTRFSQLKLVNDDISVTITEEGDIEGANYDIGRIRLYLYVISKSLKERVFNVRRILKGTDEGIKKLEELYMEYAADYEKRTGKVFAMDREAFYDMVRSNLRKQEQEMAIFAALFVMLFTSGVIGPDDDEGRAAKNRHRYFQKVLKKFYDEIGFFYNPFNITSQLSAGVPAISILDDFAKFIDHVVMEVTGLDVSDPTKSYEEVKKKAKPVKYFYKMLPGTRSFLNYMAIASDDFAKEYDITIQKEPRR